jgi:hypothetical protein
MLKDLMKRKTARSVALKEVGETDPEALVEVDKEVMVDADADMDEFAPLMRVRSRGGDDGC